jgi:hypothetical protein
MGLSADATAARSRCRSSILHFVLVILDTTTASTVYPDLLQAQAVQQSSIFQGEPILSQIFYPLTEIGLQSGMKLSPLDLIRSHIRYKLYPFFPPSW